MAHYFDPERHLERIRESGRFRFAREIVCHGFDEVHAARIVGLAESIRGPRTLFGDAAPEVEETFARLREAVQRVLGERSFPMVVYTGRAAASPATTDSYIDASR